MKLIILLLTTAIIQVSASTYGQNVTLKQNNASLVNVFTEIRKQTGYDFFYSDKMMDSAKPITVNLKNLPLEEVLKKIFAEQPLQYELKDNRVIVYRKEPSFLDNIKDKVNAYFAAIDVRGRIVDEKGRPIPGASIKVKDNNKGTQSDLNGFFSISSVDEETILVISYIGYQNKEILAKANLGNIILELSDNKLDEIQIQAYGKTSVRLNTGNVSTIKAADIEKQPVANPLLALQGRVTGVQITPSSGLPGAAIEVRVQGTNSLSSGNDPLYVIDGVPYLSQLPTYVTDAVGTGGSLNNGRGGGNPLTYLNPADIESIDILKDADATAIYGSRAANGAVLITTKKGKAGPVQVDVNIQNGWSKMGRFQKMLNTTQYLEMRKEAFRNDNLAQTSANAFDILGLYGYDTTRTKDWQKEVLGGSAQFLDAQLGISGGTSLSNYRIAMGYQRQTTITPGDFADNKGSFSLNLNTASANQRFTLGFTGQYVFDNNKLQNTTPILNIMRYAPTSPELYNADGSINWALDAAGNSTWFGQSHPLAALEQHYQNTTGNLIANFIAGYRILDDLNFKTQFSYTNLHSDEVVTSPVTRVAPALRPFTQRSSIFAKANVNSFTMEPQLSYQKNFGKSMLSALIGGTFNSRNTGAITLNASGFNTDLQLEDPAAAATITSTNNYQQYRYVGVFARFSYNYADKYLANLTARRDGSSNFGPENRFNNFLSASGAWIFTEENFAKDNFSFLSFGKIKASYGTTGNDQVGAYSYLDLYKPLNTAISYQGIPATTAGTLYNPELQWEETTKFLIGLELGFWKDRLLLSSSYARNRSTNQLIGYSLPTQTGSGTVNQNLPALLQNTSVEFSLNTINLKTKDLNWTTNLNLTIPRNKLVSFPEQDRALSFAGLNSLKIGYPYPPGNQYFAPFAGIDPSTGLFRVLDVNGNPITTAPTTLDRTVIYNFAYGLMYGGVSNTFSYKGLQLDFLFQLDKRPILNYYGLQVPGTRSVNQLVDVMDRWQKPGDIAAYQKFTTSNAIGNQISNSDASFDPDAYVLRFQNVSLSYTLSKRWQEKVKLKNARIFAHGQNLWTITSYKGLDPIIGNGTTIPLLRTFTIGFQAGF